MDGLGLVNRATIVLTVYRMNILNNKHCYLSTLCSNTSIHTRSGWGYIWTKHYCCISLTVVNLRLTLIMGGCKLFIGVHLQVRKGRAEHLLVLCDQRPLQFCHVIH